MPSDPHPSQNQSQDQDQDHSHSPDNAFLSSRMLRCEAMGLAPEAIRSSCSAAIDHDRPLIAIVCSRVGHDPQRHRRLSQQIAASLQQARRENASVLVADGTAIEPWVTHAAALFQVPMVRLGQAADRDREVIAIADRVDAAYVRGGGKIAGLLQQRARMQAGMVRVAIDNTTSQRQTIWELLDAGVVGQFLPMTEVARDTICKPAVPGFSASRLSLNSIDWSAYLVHCTRSAAGPWPGQTWAQYRDDLLLADPHAAARDTLDTLCRIVRMRRLVAGALTSHRATPVVCFSAVELPTLLAGRTYRGHLHRWDYEPMGIAITRLAATRLGIEKVIYGTEQQRSELTERQRYRFQTCGKTYDWTAEQEWRSATDVDLSKLDRQDVLIFVADEEAADRVAWVNRAQWSIVCIDPPRAD